MRQLKSVTDLEDLLTRTSPRGEPIRLPGEQRGPVVADPAPGVIIAGAGTGKTTVMAARVAWLVGTGQVAPGAILGLTFTRFAARQLADAFRRVLAGLDADPDDQPTVSTYDAFAGRLVSEYGAWEGRDRVRLMTNAEPYVWSAAAVKAHVGTLPHLATRSLTSVIASVVNLDGQMQSHLVDMERVREATHRLVDQLAAAPLRRGVPLKVVSAARAAAEERLELLDLVSAYRDIKRQAGVASFPDQMAQAVGLADRHPDIGQWVRGRYRAVLLDEYQDTSGAQTHLLRRLFGATGAELGYPVLAVGDPLQAIYGWRGAAVDGIFEFHHDFPAPTEVTYALGLNRRSGSAVLGVANRLTRRISDPLLQPEQRLELAAARTTESQIEAAEFSTWPEECGWVADRVGAVLASGTPPDEVAILVRRHEDMADLAAACAERGIEVAVVGLAGLLVEPHVAQIVALLRLVADGRDDAALVTILTGPRFGVGPGDLAALARRATELAADDETTLLSAVRDPGNAPLSARARSAARALTRDVDVLTSWRGTLPDRVAAAAGRTGARVEAALASPAAASRVSHFLTHVVEYAAGLPDASLAGFLAYVDAAIQHADGLPQPSPTPGTVLLATVHQAKGLEWDAVFLPALVAGTFPQDSLRDNPATVAAQLPTNVRSDAASLVQLGTADAAGLKAYEEGLRQALGWAEDRLAYVAFTRARHQLVATTHRWYPGRVRARRPSPYFEDVAALAADHGTVTRLLVPDDDVNPLVHAPEPCPWPAPDDPTLRAAARAVWRAQSTPPTASEAPEELLSAADRDRVAQWDAALAHLAAEAADSVIAVELPSPLTVSMALAARADPAGLAARLARPVPQPPSARARRGVAFHAWVQRYYGTAVLPDLEPDEDVTGFDAERAGFLASPWAAAVPAAVERSIAVELGGQVVTGRIDAVFTRADNPALVPEGTDALIVDWKTGGQTPDPAQVGLYAWAWAAITGTPIDRVAAAFVTVRSGATVGVLVPTRREVESWVRPVAQ